MNTRSAVLVFIAMAAACGGKLVSAPDSTGTTLGGAAGQDPSDPISSRHGSPDAGGHDDHGSGIDTTCVNESSSASGGPGSTPGSYSCQTDSAYRCAHDEKAISCTCQQVNGVWQPGSCTCGDGDAIAFDCARGCLPGATEYNRCHLPAPDVDYGGFSSSSASSSG